ncbi:MAG TPA: dTDP-4-amino-4,6-dideoxygalactose transaminase [Gammaproteobacteria bacterium]|nr:dTDP-4-amino-4,6-dideoxygalactose transaminase [Gammaproteobacteria bacterium]
MTIPFNKPYIVGHELQYISEAHALGKLAGDGSFTKKCQAWLEQNVGCKKALLTHSCTAALEMAAILLNIQPGDEVIMPSYTFVSTANAFVLRGGVPVFIDIRADTLNMDETKIEAAITPKTKAIVPVHYAGVGCEMQVIMDIAKKHNLYVVEDAAQGVMSSYQGRPLGSFGHMAAFSFHETKNIISGEGGALLINDPQFIERAEVIREKGTDRSRFFRGEVDKYTWQDIGSSFLPGEIIAAFLWAQMEEAENITSHRLALWDAYHASFAGAEAEKLLRRPVIPGNCQHNAHMYYLLLPDLARRTKFKQQLQDNGNIHAVPHYIPLHSSPAGQKFGHTPGKMDMTNTLADCLIRLPLWVGLEDNLDSIVDQVNKAIRSSQVVV